MEGRTRGRDEMIRKRVKSLVAILGATAVGCASVAGAAAINSQEDEGRVSVVAVFDDAGSLIRGNLVNVRGMEVGTVEEIKLEAGKARVTMDVQRSVLPVHVDASAVIKPTSLLGEQHIELNTGSDSAPALDEPMRIPANRTSSSVDIDEILNSLDNPTSTSLAALLTSLGEGMKGNGGRARDALKALGPAMTQTGRLAGVLNQQNQALTQLLDRVKPVAGQLSLENGNELDRLVTSFKQTMSTVAANREALKQTVTELPAFMSKARSALAELSGTAKQTRPLLANIRPTTNNLSEISRELKAFADAADPALTTTRPVLERAKGMLEQAAPLVKSLRPTMGHLKNASIAAKPTAQELTDNLTGLLDMISGWALATTGYDSVSHYFRGMLVATPKPTHETARALALGGAGNVGGKDPKQKSPGAPDGSAPGSPSEQQKAPDPGNATGLTQNQERSMVEQLLGGGR